ncbi:MAG: GNAT family N-acetyltransferase [Eubacteriales bacterium]|nr:GNAT family N-acetyltransferase [Eubacteriales bacterium]
MERISLVPVSQAYAEEIGRYRAEFSAQSTRATYVQDRIPGLDHLEEYEDAREWLRLCERMRGRISWYLGIREGDGRLVGCLVLRHRLEYDDDDPEFASHIGYSVRPGERGKGYAKELLRLGLQKAAEHGLHSVRLICLDRNTASSRVISANGGVQVDSIYGEESGMTVLRYDVPTMR